MKGEGHHHNRHGRKGWGGARLTRWERWVFIIQTRTLSLTLSFSLPPPPLSLSLSHTQSISITISRSFLDSLRGRTRRLSSVGAGLDLTPMSFWRSRGTWVRCTRVALRSPKVLVEGRVTWWVVPECFTGMVRSAWEPGVSMSLPWFLGPLVPGVGGGREAERWSVGQKYESKENNRYATGSV